MATSTDPRSASNLRFQCGECKTTLEVPAEFAGVSAPCPHCSNLITAPKSPPPADHFERSWQEAQLGAAADVAPARATSLQSVEPAERQVVAAGTPENLDPTKDASGTLVKSRVGKGPNLPKILGWGSCVLTVGAAVFVLMVARYSEPKQRPPKEVVVSQNLTTQVLWQKDRMDELKQKAVEQAVSVVQQFLKQGGGAGTASLVQSIAETPPKIDGEAFAKLDTGSLSATAVTRKPGTEDFVSLIEPTDGRGPVFIVEQNQGAAKIHGDALAQQAANSWAGFLKDQASGPVMLYVSARPFRGQFPVAGLETWQKIDIMPPFPMTEASAFVACAAPGSPAAAALLKHPSTAGWGRIVAEFRWSQTKEGKPFIELARVVPNSWARY